MRSIQATGILARSSRAARRGRRPALGQEAATAVQPVVAAGAAGRAGHLSDDAIAIRDGLPAALSALPGGQRDAIEAFFLARQWAPFWTARRAPRRPRWSRPSTRPATRRCRRPATTRQGLAALFARHRRDAGEARGRGDGGLSALRHRPLRRHRRAGVARIPSTSAAARAPGAGALLAALDSRAARRRCSAGWSRKSPTIAAWSRRSSASKASPGPGAGARGRRRRDLHPGDDDPRVAELPRPPAPASATFRRAARPSPRSSTPGYQAAVERFQGDVRPRRRRRRRQGDARRDQRAGRDAAGRSVTVNLERMRWMPRDMGAR